MVGCQYALSLNENLAYSKSSAKLGAKKNSEKKALAHHNRNRDIYDYALSNGVMQHIHAVAILRTTIFQIWVLSYDEPFGSHTHYECLENYLTGRDIQQPCPVASPWTMSPKRQLLPIFRRRRRGGS